MEIISDHRIESDSIGSHQVPIEAYYGVQSLRAQENFNITGNKLHPTFIQSLAYIKKAAAVTNEAIHRIDNKKSQAIIEACNEIIEGKLLNEFIVDPIQGGAGTSMNMNANEVIANRANTLLQGDKGDYNLVHPNDHVNYGQSTNDVIPTAGKITAYQLCIGLQEEMVRLQETLEKKAKEFDHILKMGRTQMQDAIPIRLGQEFKAYAVAVERNRQRLNYVIQEILTVNMGATAIGTGLNADSQYVQQIVPELASITGIPLVQADDLIDGTQHIDSFSMISGVLRTFALTLSKMANDLRLISSGPKTGFNEINLPKKQNGSSIMPGKVNPVIPEVINQIAFKVAGNDTTIAMAVEAGQLELNAFEPVIFYALFESISILENGIKTFIDNCLIDITANEDRCKELLESSVGIITALVPHIGYQKGSEIANEALFTGQSVKDLILKEELLSEEELERILAPDQMTRPGICQR